MFDRDRFIEACRAAVGGADATRVVRELVLEAVSDAASLSVALGEPEHAGFRALHHAPNLTILDFTWAPWMCFKPHNHSMWSVVGILFGREDNMFWRRVEGTIEGAGARSLGPGDVTY